MKNWVINKIGCLIARWIIHNCEDGLVIKRQSGSRQIIKVFSEPAWKNVIKPAMYKTESLKGKQIPKKPIAGADLFCGYDGNGEVIWITDYTCAECGCGVAGEYRVCPYCGQVIDWSDSK